MAKSKLSEALDKTEPSTQAQDDAQDTNSEPPPAQAAASIPAIQATPQPIPPARPPSVTARSTHRLAGHQSDRNIGPAKAQRAAGAAYP